MNIAKVGKVSNPLTIIAIFAGLAEIGGTFVLPFLDLQIQKVYIWFLMLFPTLLVLTFFIVLYKKHVVLYAPSDFKKDKNFMASHGISIAKAKPKELERKLEDEKLEDEKLEGEKLEGEKLEGEKLEGEKPKKSEIQYRNRINEKQFENLILLKLAKDYINITKDVSIQFKGYRNFIFDFSASKNNKNYIIEAMRLISIKQYSVKNIIKRKLAIFNEVFIQLTAEQRANTIFYLIVVVENEEIDYLYKEKLSSLCKEYNFEIKLDFCAMNDLEKLY
mgnify:CR=1 FL=1